MEKHTKHGLKTSQKLDIKLLERDIIKQIAPKIEERIKFEVVKTITDALEEQFYPPEEMIREKFVKEVKEAEKEKGKVFSNKEELEQYLENMRQ